MATIIIEILEEYKVKAERFKSLGCMRCSTCPIALAINKVLKPIYSCHVGINDGCIIYNGRFVGKFTLPIVATRFINRFDGELNPAPISFALDIPDEFVRV